MTSTTDRKITISEFLDMELEEGYIYELINGDIMRRTSPNLDHQEASANLHYALMSFVKGSKLGKVYAAPLDVYLTEFDLVVPDLVFISKDNPAIQKNNRCIEGTPDLIIEILSKGTQKLDRGKKMTQYRLNKVKEYWIIDPRNQTVEVYELQNGIFEMISYAEESGEIESNVLEGFKLAVENIFA